MRTFNDELVKCRKCTRLVNFRETVLSGNKRYAGEEFASVGSLAFSSIR